MKSIFVVLFPRITELDEHSCAFTERESAETWQAAYGGEIYCLPVNKTPEPKPEPERVAPEPEA